MKTMLIRFTEEHGGHQGLINASDFDSSRHIEIRPEGEGEGDEPSKAAKPKAAKPKAAKPKAAKPKAAK
jgi:hypothetical protein